MIFREIMHQVRHNSPRAVSLMSLCFVMLTACNPNVNQFVVEGNIRNAEGQTLYLDEVGTGNVLSLDSALLDAKGAFIFRHEGSQYPMFYRLRLGSASIPFAADSASHIVIESEGSNFFTGYSLREADSYNHQIRDIAILRHKTDKQIDSIVALHQARQIAQGEAVQAVDSLVQGFKRYLTSHYIYVDPKSPAAYFALFQQKEGGAYFFVDDIGDERAFAAVATAYDTYYPKAPYTPFLKKMALEALAQERERKAMQTSISSASERGIKTINFPDFSLNDQHGKAQTLSTIAERGAVLLSFTSYQLPYSPNLVSELKALQSKRADLSIVEVSVDKDLYYWRNATHKLPWVCVVDTEGQIARSYNVQTLPTLFLIEGGVLRRLSNIDELTKR